MKRREGGGGEDRRKSDKIEEDRVLKDGMGRGRRRKEKEERGAENRRKVRSSS